MARIVIKGRRDPIEIENDRAQKIKDRWLGLNGAVKAEPNDVLDLGIWSGEYGRIGEIEMTFYSAGSPVEDKTAKYQEEERKRLEEWAKLTPEEKGKRLAPFKLAYGVRTGKYNEPVPEDILKKAEKVQVEFYKKNPKAFGVPNEVFGSLLPPRTAPTIAQKMTVNTEKVLSGIKCICGKELYLGQEACSGKCLLEKKNGGLSTK